MHSRLPLRNNPDLARTQAAPRGATKKEPASNAPNGANLRVSPPGEQGGGAVRESAPGRRRQHHEQGRRVRLQERPRGRALCSFICAAGSRRSAGRARISSEDETTTPASSTHVMRQSVRVASTAPSGAENRSTTAGPGASAIRLVRSLAARPVARSTASIMTEPVKARWLRSFRT